MDYRLKAMHKRKSKEQKLKKDIRKFLEYRKPILPLNKALEEYGFSDKEIKELIRQIKEIEK